MKKGNLVGDYVKVWSNRYVVFRDTHIAWYLYQNCAEPQGCFLADNSFTLSIDGGRLQRRKEFSCWQQVCFIFEKYKSSSSSSSWNSSKILRWKTQYCVQRLHQALIIIPHIQCDRPRIVESIHFLADISRPLLFLFWPPRKKYSSLLGRTVRTLRSRGLRCRLSVSIKY